jgi:uncharacterized protein (UPF0333 family)
VGLLALLLLVGVALLLAIGAMAPDLPTAPSITEHEEAVRQALGAAMDSAIAALGESR